MAATAVRLRVTGAVQGVGYRPFVHGLAVRHGVAGRVSNDPGGVDIEAEGDAEAVRGFVDAIRGAAPPLARVERVVVAGSLPQGRARFEIATSSLADVRGTGLPPDAGICADCLREVRDPRDRRHRHPFANCTSCGPRMTIAREVPWDRARTTMDSFPMCARCAAEYADPGDRRFHAQPVACRECGPRVRLVGRDAAVLARDDEAVARARELLASGRIVAVKGLGGVHVACDAADEDAVAELRRRKRRGSKPFAVLVRSVDAARRLADVSPDCARSMESAARPIVIVPRVAGARIAPSVAPSRSTLGIALPSTALHDLLLDGGPEVLVLTSGNASGDPIAIDDADAVTRLADVADAFLLHDREILVRADDSVVRPMAARVVPVRRGRGIAPLPVTLVRPVPPVVAVGADLKNAFCAAFDLRAVPGPHVGDLGSWESRAAFEESLARFERLVRVQPVAFAHDLHPDFASTRYAVERAARDGLRAIAVQHHHAHAVSCMADNGLDPLRPVVAVVFDGAGLGPDGTVWGGEILVVTARTCVRAAHLAEVALPGGDAAAREPWRMALAWLRASGVEWTPDLAPVVAAGRRGAAVVRALCDAPRTPRTTSAGRLFDAVASIAGICHRNDHEGQAAAELESAADAWTGPHVPRVLPVAATGPIDPAPAIREAADAAAHGRPPAEIAARFHEWIALAAAGACARAAADRGIADVVLSGGVFQNARLTTRVADLLAERGLCVRVHREVPPNDGGIALGQAVIAGAILGEEV